MEAFEAPAAALLRKHAGVKIEILDLEATFAVVVRRSVSFAAMPHAQREARLALAAFFGGAVPSGPRLTIWRPLRDGLLDHAPGVVIPAPIDVAGDIEVFSLPAGRAAHLRFDGGYEGLGGAWKALFEECAARGIKTAGLNWEVYAAEAANPNEVGAHLYAMLEHDAESRHGSSGDIML